MPHEVKDNLPRYLRRATDVVDGLAPRLGRGARCSNQPGRTSQIAGSESGSACDARQHARADLIAVVKSEDEVLPARSREHPM